MSMRGYAELLARQQAPAEKSGEWAERIVHHLDRLDESAQLISQRHVFYAAESVDITSAVVQYMNNEFKSGEKQ